MVDIRNPVWFGRLTVTGQKPQLSGPSSIIQMSTEFVAQLRSLNPRDSAKGKNIAIEFSSIPFDSAISPLERLAAEVENSLDFTLEGGPREAESYDSFYLRLIEEGNTLATARFIADDWFKVAKDSVLSAWLTDDKAVRFRQLNSSNSAFEGAMPNEYESLKKYVKETYPEQVKEITFRTA